MYFYGKPPKFIPIVHIVANNYSISFLCFLEFDKAYQQSHCYPHVNTGKSKIEHILLFLINETIFLPFVVAVWSVIALMSIN